METVAKSVCGDYVARICFKHCVHVQDLTILCSWINPSGEHFFQILFNNGLDPTDAGIGEEAVDTISSHTVHFMIHRGNDGIRG